jgi:hypothetical protein
MWEKSTCRNYRYLFLVAVVEETSAVFIEVKDDNVSYVYIMLIYKI